MSGILRNKVIEILGLKIQQLEEENRILKNSLSRKTPKNKWGKVPWKKRHLKLIAINGVPISNKT